MLALAGESPLPALRDALSILQSDLVAVPPENTRHRAEWDSGVAFRLKRLAAKISPTMGPEQAKAWMGAVTEALTDLPALVVLTAAKRALHRPMAFISEVEGVVREIAAQVLAEHQAAARRLRDLIQSVERANAAALAAPEAFKRQYSAEQVARMSPHLRSIGIKCGALTVAQVAEAVGLDAEGVDQGEPGSIGAVVAQAVASVAGDERSSYVPQEEAA